MKGVETEQLSFHEEVAQFRKSVDQMLLRLEVRPHASASLTIVRKQFQGVLGNEDKILGAIKRYLETTYGAIPSHSCQTTRDNVDGIFNTIHQMNTTLSHKVDRQANHETFSEPSSQRNKRDPEIDPVVPLFQLFELEGLQFERMEDGLEPSSAGAIRR